MRTALNKRFSDVVGEIADIGFQKNADVLIEHAKANLPDVKYSVRQLPPLSEVKTKSAVIVSAGPSIYRKNIIERILKAGYRGTIICADGAFIACLKAGLQPDYVLTLDPHETRIVRWFGDPDFEENSKADNYFARQDLDENFRQNSIEQNKQHIDLINTKAGKTKAIVGSSSPRNVIARLKDAGCEMYWWNPLVDDPDSPDSISRKLYNINLMPCINTGGNVGTAAWTFASEILGISQIALTGMDLGYYADTPKEQTQTYYELVHHLGSDFDLNEFFPEFVFPTTNEKFYTDPTYFWYRRNFLELYKMGRGTTYNCTDGGTLIDSGLKCVPLEDFFEIVNQNS